MAEKKKRLTVADLAEQHARHLAELHQHRELVSELMEKLDMQQQAYAMLNQRLEAEIEAREQTTEVLRDALRLLWIYSRSPSGSQLHGNKLALLGKTLNEYLPEFDEATA